jgi:hypothetical protein
MYDIPFISMMPMSCQSSTLDRVIAAANTDIDVAANDVEIPMLRSTIDALLVSTGSENVTSHDRIGIRLTQIS